MWRSHYCDVIMGAIASKIISLTIVYSTVYSDADQRKHQSSASLAFVWGIHRWPVPSDDVIMPKLPWQLWLGMTVLKSKEEIRRTQCQESTWKREEYFTACYCKNSVRQPILKLIWHSPTDRVYSPFLGIQWHFYIVATRGSVWETPILQLLKVTKHRCHYR